MYEIISGLLWGLLAGVIIVPIFLLIRHKIKNTRERLSIKAMINKGQYLVPMDSRDYDTRMWDDKIKAGSCQKDMGRLSKIVVKPIESNIEDELGR